MPRVEAGQRWKSTDSRFDRTVEIVDVDETHATIRSAAGRETRIALRFFGRGGSAGWKLVE